jgi:hypothetical protein
MFFKPKKKNKKYFILSSFLLGVLFTFIFFGVVFSARALLVALKSSDEDLTIIEPVRAAEIYPEFVCSCCGRPLDPSKICCGDMKRKIDYIDHQVEAGFSKDEIMMAATKEFGINSLAKEETKQEIKSMLLASAPADAPKIVFAQTSYDFGEVSQADGVVFTLFTIKNAGEGDLVIDKLSTSCGCTMASIVYNGVEGPTFTMPGHGKENPKNWSVSITPGDTAQVKVYFDPNVHGKQKEPSLDITRTVSVFSNDPVEFEKQIRIELTQVP